MNEHSSPRVPHRPETAGDWCATAALLVEIVSPGDETWDKLPFYAAHHVDELLIVDPHRRTGDWLSRSSTTSIGRCSAARLIELAPAELAERVDWPATDIRLRT